MSLVRYICFALFILTASISTAGGDGARGCAPPSGFVDSPHPPIAGAEEIVVDRPLAVVLAAGSRTSLKDTIHNTDSLPGVGGDYPLSSIPFGTPGARRLVCLTDGSTLEEQVLDLAQSKSSYRFRYVVWNYTTEKARPIFYGVGEFRDWEIGGGHTHIVWTYSFKLKDHEFPGYLGGFGRYLFRVIFLDREYAALMRATLAAGKASAEK